MSIDLTQKSHQDYLNIIGETCATGKSRVEVAYNKYYLRIFESIVGQLVRKWYSGKPHGFQANKILDVGTSHGVWFPYLKKIGQDVFGVELSSERAQQARAVGYTEVFNVDASSIPLPDATIDLAVSNDVFVHILRLEDKKAVLREVYRVLKPGGAFIVNHPMSQAFGHTDYTVKAHCSFLSLSEWSSVATSENFEIQDVQPTYFRFRSQKAPKIKELLERFIFLPAAPAILSSLDRIIAKKVPAANSDTVYLLLTKRERSEK